jgi:hypothetical protein
MTDANEKTDLPPFPIGAFPIRILAARPFARGNRAIGVVDLEIAADGGASRIQIELLLDAPPGPSMPIVLRDLRLIDSWRRTVGVDDARPGPTRPFPLLMKDIAFKSQGKSIRAEIVANRSPWGWKPRLAGVSIGGAGDNV